MLSSLKRSCRVSELCGSRKLSLCDNLPAVLALDKGRSSSGSMNRICKSAAALQAACQIRWRLRHIETLRNVADKPSRHLGHRVSVHQFCSDVKTDEASRSKSSPSKGSSVRRLISLVDVVPPPGLGEDSRTQYKHEESCRSRNSLAEKIFSHSAIDDSGHCVSDSSPCRKKKGFLKAAWEIFCGEGNLTLAMKHNGIHVVEGFDIKKSPVMDLTNQHVQDRVRDLIRSGHIGYIHFGTPCTIFSRARRGIINLRKARAREIVGCELAYITAELVVECMRMGIKWSIENPKSSRLWEFPDIQILSTLPGVIAVNFPMCAFGERYKKPTMLLTNSSELTSLSSICIHTRHSEVLVGRVKNETGEWVNRTTLAGSYPHKLCQQWAQAVKRALIGDHVQTQSRPTPPDLIEWISAAKGQDSQETWCVKPSKFTAEVRDSIVFGQHSKAEAAKRRSKKVRQRWIAKRSKEVFEATR